MNIYEYIKTYNYTFNEKPFNEVDNVILSMLAYVDYEGILTKGKKKKLLLKDVASEYYENKYRFKIKEIVPAKVGVKLLKEVSMSNRFQNLLMYNYEYLGNDDTQFSALTFEDDNFIYIAYEGTDALISGWDEDFRMSYKFPVPAHKKAIKYLNKYMFSKKKIIVGGHSKGGNLALIASMYANPILYHKIINIYSNDGQGLRDKEYLKRKHNRVSKKIIHLMPQNTIVGVLFKRRKENDIVVKSNALPILSHDASTWKIDKDKFIRSVLTKGSKVLDEGLDKWFNKYSYVELKEFMSDIFGILKDNNIVTLYQIMDNPLYIITIIKASSKLNEKTRLMFNDFLGFIKEVKESYK